MYRHYRVQQWLGKWSRLSAYCKYSYMWTLYYWLASLTLYSSLLLYMLSLFHSY